jgi:hypothetical protein
MIPTDMVTNGESSSGRQYDRLICATRASALAMWQARHAIARLATAGIVSTVLQISTKGDRILDRSLAALGSDSVFVKELEMALPSGGPITRSIPVRTCRARCPRIWRWPPSGRVRTPATRIARNGTPR